MKKILLSIACLFGSLLTNAQTGAALNFSGSGDYVQLADPNFGTSNFTLETWIKPNTTNGSYLISTRSVEMGGAGNWFVLSHTAGKIGMELAAAGFGATYFETPTTPVTLGSWNHVAIVRSGVQFSIYVNGVLSASYTDVGIRNFNTGQNSIRLSGWANVGVAFFNGMMDETRFWNVARTACQINTFMNCEIPTTGTGLIGNYHFNQGIASANNSGVATLTDISGSSRTGTLNNFSLTGATSNWITPGAVVSGFTTTLAPPVIAVSNGTVSVGSSFTMAPTGGVSYTYTPSGPVVSPTVMTSYTVNGTAATGCTNTAVGTVSIQGAALNFDGGNDFISIGTVIPLNSSYTKEAWIYANASGSNNIISSGSAAFWIMGGQLSTFNNGGSTIQDPATFPLNQWVHVAVTFNSTNSLSSLYKNGILVASGISNSGYTNDAIAIGQYGTSGANFFQGSIDEVRLWNVARTQCEIISYMNCEIPGSATALLANYHFNQGIVAVNNSTVNTLTDVSGNSNDGTLTNFALNGSTSNWVAPGGVTTGSTTPSTCTPAAALDFDGANDDVRATGFPNFTEYTIEGWFNLNSLVDQNLIVGTGNGNPNTWFTNQLQLTGGKFTHYLYDGAAQMVTSPITPVTGVWYHVAIVAKNGNPVSIYVNGMPSVSNSNVGSMSGANEYRMAGTANGILASFNGQMDEVRIWNVARSQCEINTYKNCEIPSTSTGLVANYHFNQGIDAFGNPTVATLTDASGNSNTGTLTNFALTGATSNWVAPGAVVSGYTTSLVPPLVNSTVTNSVICNGNSTTLSGTGANTYSWTNSVADATAFSPTITATYTVTGTNTLTGCSNTAVNTLTVNALPTISVNSGAICTGNSFTMVPSGAVTYSFSNGSAIATPTANATYSVSGTDANGCVSNVGAISSVTVNALPTISVNSGAICTGKSFTMIPIGAVTYTYSNGSAIATPTANASYNVTGTDANGCVSNVGAISSVTVNALPTIAVNSGAICTGKSFTMTPSGAVTYTYSNGSAIVSPTATASYSVTGTSTKGCVSSNTAVSSVTVNSLPTVMAATNSTLLCVGNSATLTASGATSYTWNTAATATVIAVSPTTTVTYTVNGTGANGCSNSAIVTQSVSACTGIVSLSNDAAIKLYPNPNNGLFTIELTSLSKVTVTNALGQIVIADTFEAGNHNLDIINQSNGVYFVKVIENNKQQIIKVIKQ